MVVTRMHAYMPDKLNGGNIQKTRHGMITAITLTHLVKHCFNGDLTP